MEDRATLRISSQLLANWLAQDIITESELDASLVRLAAVKVDTQSGRPHHDTASDHPAGPSLAQRRRGRLIIDGGSSPSGYTAHPSPDPLGQKRLSRPHVRQ
jgi:malate synthase